MLYLFATFLLPFCYLCATFVLPVCNLCATFVQLLCYLCSTLLYFGLPLCNLCSTLHYLCATFVLPFPYLCVTCELSASYQQLFPKITFRLTTTHLKIFVLIEHCSMLSSKKVSPNKLHLKSSRKGKRNDNTMIMRRSHKGSKKVTWRQLLISI